MVQKKKKSDGGGGGGEKRGVLYALAEDGKGEAMLRHASRSRGRVVEERMTAFVSINPVKHVALLRAAETAPLVERL